jgi:beta-glucosidase/6-phospho-beta-glucosidase/beta-galactosidase
MSPQFVEDFENFADVLFEAFGDRIKNWMTFNEPWVTCFMQVGLGFRV